MAEETSFGYRAYDIARADWLGTVDSAAVHWFQHLIVLRARMEMAAGATTQAALASYLGEGSGNVAKKFAGTVPLQFDDVVRLAIAFGPAVIPEIDQPADLIPPGLRNAVSWDRREAGMARPRFA